MLCRDLDQLFRKGVERRRMAQGGCGHDAGEDGQTESERGVEVQIQGEMEVKVSKSVGVRIVKCRRLCWGFLCTILKNI